MAIDCHCHLNDQAFEEDLQNIVGSLTADKVDYAIISGYNLESSLKAIEIAEKSEILYACTGFHPENVDDIRKGDFEKLIQTYNHPKVVAVGEIGLDYHWRQDNKKEQKKIFLKQLGIAESLKMPVVIHQRDCGMDVLEILKKRGVKDGVVLHCFSESVEMAKEFVKLGCYISLGGVITYKNAGKLLDVAKFVPKDLLLTETDSPYLTPVPKRGKRNEPKYTNFVLDKLAELRNEDREQLAQAIENNFKRVFTKIK